MSNVCDCMLLKFYSSVPQTPQSSIFLRMKTVLEVFPFSVNQFKLQERMNLCFWLLFLFVYSSFNHWEFCFHFSMVKQLNTRCLNSFFSLFPTLCLLTYKQTKTILWYSYSSRKSKNTLNC